MLYVCDVCLLFYNCVYWTSSLLIKKYYNRFTTVIIVYRNRISRGLYCSEWSRLVVQSAQYVWPQVEVVMNTNDNYKEIRQYLS